MIKTLHKKINYMVVKFFEHLYAKICYKYKFLKKEKRSHIETLKIFNGF